MFFDAKAAAISARQTHLSTFRKHLKSSVFTTLVVAALSSGAQAQTVGKYYNADGSRTDNLEAAAATWRNDPEFKLGWGAAAMKAEYAYALGITGLDNKTNERVKIGIMDSGFLNTHSEFSPTTRFTPVITNGVSGNFIPVTNDGHGTKVTGVIGAARNGTGIEGVAFDADLIIGNTNATDGLLFGAKPSSGNSYLALVYDAIAAKNVRLISNSWGSKPGNENYSTLADLAKAYLLHDGKNTWIEGAMRASIGKDGKDGIINNFSAGNNGYDNASLRGSLPYFRPELEGHWMTTTGFSSNQTEQIYNRCGIAKYWCIMAPTIVDTTDEFGDIDSGFNGTSAAAPHASAALALMMQRYPYMTNEQALTVLFTTAQNMVPTKTTGDLTTPIVAGTEKVPNAVTGWGLVDLQKGMNGPGQFFGAFNVSMSKGQDDTWSNNISEEAIVQRQKDDKAEHDAWVTYKTSKGWNNGLPSDASDADRSEFSYKTAREAAYQARQYIGSLSKSGAGKLSLTGKNTYSGDTLINGGELSIGLGGSIVSTSFINDTGLLSVDGTAANATVSSGGWLKVNTSGTTGDVTLNGGLASIDGKSGKAIVNTNGLLGGIGTVASILARQGGTVSPGNSIGTLDASGGVTFDAGSKFLVEVSPSSDPVKNKIDLLAAGGAALLNGGWVWTHVEGGGIDLTKADVTALYASPYTFLTATSGVSGQFEGALPNYPFIQLSLAYNPQDVTLGFSRNAVKFADLAATPNQKAVANAIESIGAGNRLFNTVLFSEANDGAVSGIDKGAADTAVTQRIEADRLAAQAEADRLAAVAKAETDRLAAAALAAAAQAEADRLAAAAPKDSEAELAKQLQALFDATRGDVHATLKGVVAQDTRFISQSAIDRIRAVFDGVATKPQPVTSPLAYASETKNQDDVFAAIAPAGASIAAWGHVYGAWSQIDGDANATGYSRNAGGFVTGFDGVVADTWRLGVLAGYGNTVIDANRSFANIDNYQLGLYGGTQWNELGLRGGVNLGQHVIDTTRGDPFGRHSASYDAKSVQVFGELGYEIKTAYAAFEPFAGASYVHLTTDGFAENGVISNLTGLSGSTDPTTTTLGLRASHDFALSESITLTARGMAGWSHAFGDVTPQQRLAFSGGQAFTIEGLPIAQDTAIVEAGFDVGIGENTTLGLGYTGQFSNQASDNAVRADLTVRF